MRICILPYYFHHNFIYEVYSKRLLESYLGFQEENVVVDSESSGYSFYISEPELQRIQLLASGWFASPVSVRTWIKSLYRTKAQVSKLPWETRSASSEELIEQISAIELLFQKCVALHLVTQPHLTSVLEYRLQQVMSVLDSESFNLLTLPTRLPAVLEEQRQWYQIVLLARDGGEISEELERHLNIWKYITAGDSRSPMDIEYLRSRRDTDAIQLDFVRKNLQQLEEVKTGQRKSMLRDLLASSHFGEDVIYAASLVRTCAYLRFHTKQMWMKLWYLLENCLKRLSEVEAVGFAQVCAFSSEELKAGLHKSSDDDRTSYFYTLKAGEASLFYNGSDLAQREEHLSPMEYGSIEELAGQTGYRGRVIGRVLKIDWQDDVSEKCSLISQDTVLVTPQTTPALVGLLTRCIGLVTDEGGITGHASIVSRELKIPSVIGTRYATRVFKTGDLIEVDGYHGKVTLLSRDNNQGVA